MCSQVHAVIGVLMDDTDPLVTVMKVEKAPQETYADIGGLDQQIQEIKVTFSDIEIVEKMNTRQTLLLMLYLSTSFYCVRLPRSFQTNCSVCTMFM